MAFRNFLRPIHFGHMSCRVPLFCFFCVYIFNSCHFRLSFVPWSMVFTFPCSLFVSFCLNLFLLDSGPSQWGRQAGRHSKLVSCSSAGCKKVGKQPARNLVWTLTMGRRAGILNWFAKFWELENNREKSNWIQLAGSFISYPLIAMFL